MNAFLWRASFDVSLVAIYSLATWLTTPVGFYLIGKIMRSVPVNRIFFAATLAQSLVITSLIFLKPIGALPIIIFGLLNGFSIGLYWANRNLLTFKSVPDNQRVYFYSLENVSATIGSIVIPPIVGWFLISSQGSYSLLAAISLLVTFFAAWQGKKMATEKLNLGRISLAHASLNWNRVRSLFVLTGAFNGLEMFLPALLILILVGNEKSLGFLLSITAAMAAGATYLVGRAKKHDLFQILLIGVIFTVAASLVIGISYTTIGVVIFLALNSVGNSFRWLAIMPIFYNSISLDEHGNKNHHFSYIFDVEVFIALGRGLGIGFFLLTFYLLGDLANRFALPIFGLLQLGLLYFGRKIWYTLSTNV